MGMVILSVQGDLTSLVPLLEMMGLGVIVLIFLRTGVKQGVRAAMEPRKRPSFGAGTRDAVPVVTPDYPRLDPKTHKPVAPPPPASSRYQCDGVDRETQMDATEYVEAQSPANAKVKAELRGMIVTKVTPLPPAD